MCGRVTNVPEIKRKIRTKVYVIFEGMKTEPDYFTNFERYHKESACFQLESIPKEGIDWNETHRPTLFEIAHGFVKKETAGKLTDYYLTTIVLNDYKKWAEVQSDEEIKNTTLINIRNSIIREMKTKNIVDDKSFIRNKTKALELIYAEIKKHTKHSEYVFDDVDLINNSEKDDSNFRVFIVFDRDFDMNCPEKRTKEEYEKIISMSEKEKYEVLLSTPAFELWLLMHHQNIDYIDVDCQPFLLPPVENLLYSSENLDKTRSHKRIDKYRFERYYLNNFEHAVERSKEYPFETDLKKLLERPGSNVGITLNSLLK